MKTDKKFGFTLSEVLIVLVIIGIVAVLTLPSLLKDIQAKAKVNALTSTIDNVQKAIDKELVEKRANTLNDTNIISNQGEFFREHFSLAPNPQSTFAASYRFYSGATPSGDDLPPLNATCLLKNGVAIGLHRSGTIMAINIPYNTIPKAEVTFAGKSVPAAAPKKVPVTQPSVDTNMTPYI